MIDPLNETVVSLHDAANLCPKRHGKKPHISCLYRWTSTGCRGEILESIQVGGTRCTSREALARFFRRLTENTKGAPAPSHTSAQRRKEIERVEQELENAGIGSSERGGVQL